MAKDVHTVPNPSGDGWINKVGGEKRGGVHDIKAEAVQQGRDFARAEKSEHHIHNKDGTSGSATLTVTTRRPGRAEREADPALASAEAA